MTDNKKRDLNKVVASNTLYVKKKIYRSYHLQITTSYHIKKQLYVGIETLVQIL